MALDADLEAAVPGTSQMYVTNLFGELGALGNAILERVFENFVNLFPLLLGQRFVGGNLDGSSKSIPSVVHKFWYLKKWAMDRQLDKVNHAMGARMSIRGRWIQDSRVMGTDVIDILAPLG